jgi:DNA-directed RNA polymerase specialized sigma24 family protein
MGAAWVNRGTPADDADDPDRSYLFDDDEESPLVFVVGVPVPFEDFYRAELPKLVALARCVCGDALALPVAQEAMLAAQRRWDTIDELRSPETWVRRVCLDLAWPSVRRRLLAAKLATKLAGRRVDLPPLQPAGERFWEAVRGLPREQAYAISLVYALDLDLREISEVLGCFADVARANLDEARAALSTRLGTVDGDGRP